MPRPLARPARAPMIRRAVPPLAALLGPVLMGHPADAAPAEADTRELVRRIEERDAVIAALLRRVEALEKRPPSGSGEPRAAEDRSPPLVPPPPAAPQAGGEAAPDAAVTSALERSLVQEGGLLLPRGAFEIEPQAAYVFRGNRGLDIATLNGVDRVARQDSRNDRIETALNLRFGLPWRLQGEARLPYVHDRTEVALAGLTDERSDFGFGNPEFGLSRQLAHERGVLPDLLGFVRWRTGYGDDDVARDDDGLTAGLTAVKTQDPLVWVGTGSYTANLETNDVDRGDSVDFSVGSILAVGPRTSLRFFLNLGFTGKTEVEGDMAPGSDEVAGSLEIGTSAVVTPSTLLSVAADVGVTDDAPDLQLVVSLPVRF